MRLATRSAVYGGCAAGAAGCRNAPLAQGYKRQSTRCGAQRNSDGAVEQRKNPELFALAAVPSAASKRPAANSSSRPATVTLPRHRPEVLAPAGGWAQLRAAVENGADAVYFGLSDFNARARAANFEPSELPEVMQYLHERGTKGYVVVNVLGEAMGRLGSRVKRRR